MELCPRLPKPWQLQLKALFLPKAYFFSESLLLQNTPATCKSCLGHSLCHAALCKPLPFPHPSLVLPSNCK